jgi:hypothetical protein
MRFAIALLFLLSLSAHSATLLRIQCGGPGGLDAAGNVWAPDAYFTSGARWGAAEQAVAGGLPLPALPYNTLRYSAPAGTPIFYAIPLPAGSYTLKLFFGEPNKTGVGQRVFSVSANGAALITNLDLFAMAPGALKPYTVSFPLVTTGTTLRIVLTPSVGNADISGIQVDDVTPPPIPVGYKGQCEDGIRSQLIVGSQGGLFPAPYSMFSCKNMSGGSLRITRFNCQADVAGQIADLQARGSDGLLHSLLTSPVVCTTDGAEGSVLPGASYADGEVLWWFIRIVDSTDPGLPLVNQVSLVAVLEQASVTVPQAQLLGLEKCSGTGTGRDCTGMLRAKVSLGDGSLLSFWGIPAPEAWTVPLLGITWTTVK